MFTPVFTIFAITNNFLPYFLSRALTIYFAPTTQQYALLKSFSLLLLGLFLSSLATLNFSLAFLVGLLAAPLTYVPLPSTSPSTLGMMGRGFTAVLLAGMAPTMVLVAGCWCWDLSVKEVLVQAAYGWDVWGMNTQVVVWCVWWPAWVMGGVLLFGQPMSEDETTVSERKVEKL